MINVVNKILDYGNCEVVRFRGKEAYVKLASPRTERFYKADTMDELAQHSEVRSSIVEVKNREMQGKLISLPREALSACGPKRFNRRDRGAALSRVIGFCANKESAEGIVIEALRAWSSRRRVTRPTKNQETRIR